MRILDKKTNLDYKKTIGFFDRRMEKYKSDNPYSLTMYQDDNPELVKHRNEAETKKLIPLLQLDENSRILDVACGIGRWSDAITEKIEKYCGIDFCKGFIELAQSRNAEFSNREFLCSSSYELEKCLIKNEQGKFNRVLIIGSLMYLNDDDMISTLEQVERACESGAIICIREPIGLSERLTLKEQFSDELKDEYNAIYRTRNELVSDFETTLMSKGFEIDKEDFLFENQDLNNRKETAQYYFILKRNM